MIKKLVLPALSSALLFGCNGSNDNKNNDHHHDHEEPVVLFSVSDSKDIIMIKDDNFETAFSTEANGAELFLADNNEVVATLSDSNVTFFSLAEEQLHEITGIDATGVKQVAQDHHHFSLLTDEASTLYGYESLLTDTPDIHTIEQAGQTFPALTIEDEEAEKVYSIRFSNNKATIVSETETIKEVTCETPSAAIQSDALTIVNCADANLFILNQGNELYTGQVTYDETPFTGTWFHGGHGLFSLQDNQLFTAHIDSDSKEVHAEPLNIKDKPSTLSPFCSVIANTNSDHNLFGITEDGKAVVMEVTHDDPEKGNDDEHHEDILEIIEVEVLDEKNEHFSCATTVSSTSDHTFAVADNAAHTLYIIDKHGSNFHIHSRMDITTTGPIASMLVVAEDDHEHEHEEDDHEHEHEHEEDDHEHNHNQ